MRRHPAVPANVSGISVATSGTGFTAPKASMAIVDGLTLDGFGGRSRILRLYPCNEETLAAMLPARLFRRGT